MTLDIDGLSLQPGFVEGIVADRKSFPTLEEAYRHIFRRNREYTVLLWNGIPVRLSYLDDIPALAVDLIGALDAVLTSENERGMTYLLRSPNVQAVWQIDVDRDSVTVQAEWQRIPGGYESTLERLSTVNMFRMDFLCEWKLLLEQLTKAFDDSEAGLTRRQARRQLNRLRELVQKIPSRGRFYRYY